MPPHNSNLNYAKRALHDSQSSYIRLPFLRSLLLENIGLLLSSPLSNNLLPRPCSTERIRLHHKPQFLVALLPTPNIHHSNVIPPHANTANQLRVPYTKPLVQSIAKHLSNIECPGFTPRLTIHRQKNHLNFPFYIHGGSHMYKAIIRPRPQFSHEPKTSHNTLSCPKLKSLHLLNHR
jgi:hypothetical protein